MKLAVPVALGWAVALVVPLLSAACVRSPAASPPVAPAATPSHAEAHGAGAGAADDAATECDLVCQRAHVVAKVEATPDFTALETENVNAVIDGIRPELLACYTKRLAAVPSAHAYLSVNLVIEHEGRVRSITTTGGALLGPATLACIVDHIKRARFAPPHGGGNLYIEIPFSLERAKPDEQT